MITTSTSYRELPDKHGGKLHVVYESKSTRVVFSIWESPGGKLIALERDWVQERTESGFVSELLQIYE